MAEQIANFTGMEAEAVSDALQDLRQFLKLETGLEQPSRSDL